MGEEGEWSVALGALSLPIPHRLTMPMRSAYGGLHVNQSPCCSFRLVCNVGQNEPSHPLLGLIRPTVATVPHLELTPLSLSLIPPFSFHGTKHF